MEGEGCKQDIAILPGASYDLACLFSEFGTTFGTDGVMRYLKTCIAGSGSGSESKSRRIFGAVYQIQLSVDISHVLNRNFFLEREITGEMFFKDIF
jgi:hypothetical protein